MNLVATVVTKPVSGAGNISVFPGSSVEFIALETALNIAVEKVKLAKRLKSATFLSETMSPDRIQAV